MIFDGRQDVQKRFKASRDIPWDCRPRFSETPTFEGGIFLPELAGRLKVQNPITDSNKICRLKRWYKNKKREKRGNTN